MAKAKPKIKTASRPRKTKTTKSHDRAKRAVTKHAAGKLELRYIPWSTIPLEDLNPLLQRQFVVGQEIMLARVLLKKGCIVPEHSHHNEQLTYILEGALKFWIDGKEIVVNAGRSAVHSRAHAAQGRSVRRHGGPRRLHSAPRRLDQQDRSIPARTEISFHLPCLIRLTRAKPHGKFVFRFRCIGCGALSEQPRRIFVARNVATCSRSRIPPGNTPRPMPPL